MFGDCFPWKSQSIPKVALLIDSENVPCNALDRILEHAETFGKVNIRLAYGDWSTQQLSSWKATLSKNAFQTMHSFPVASRKNASDISLVIDAMDIIHNRHADVLVVVSSDADFTPLVIRARRSGIVIIGMGMNHATSQYVDSFDKYIIINESNIVKKKKKGHKKRQRIEYQN